VTTVPDTSFLPELPDSWEDTRSTLHAYALSVAAIPRAYAEAHPKWWHVSLKVTPKGLVTDPVPLESGETLELRMDLEAHQVVMTTTGGDEHTYSMAAGLTGTEMAERLIEAAVAYGLDGEYHREKFENDETRVYDPKAAELLFTLLVDVNAVFEKHRAGLEGEASPVQLWPHGFDLAFEWFGTRVETFEEEGEVTEYRSQLNLGFYPAGRPYFYSNPWPFESDRLVDTQLPHGATWHTEGWQGTILYYDLLQGDGEAREKLAEYAAAVHEIAAPTLTA
jgi:hypothetical protein